MATPVLEEKIRDEISRLSILLADTSGSVIAFVLYSTEEERQRSASLLRDSISLPVVECRLGKKQQNPLRFVRTLKKKERACVFFYAVEDALPELAGYVNLNREAFADVPHAMVFWIREYGLRALGNEAPDFWAWRSGVFDVRGPEERVEPAVTPRVFLSYARSDGALLAKALRERLEREAPEIGVWQDIIALEAGRDWFRQILEAIEKVERLVLVMTPAAQASETVRTEWLHARRNGVSVIPVRYSAGPHPDFKAMPRWMSRAHCYTLPGQWNLLVRQLQSPGKTDRVPFMADDLPKGFIQREREFSKLREQLLKGDRRRPTTITTALTGAGGFGKTTLAAALCHDEEVINEFGDGILWVTLGEKPDVRAGMATLYAALTGERPVFVSDRDAENALAEKLNEKNCLLVIDDVWQRHHLQPFLHGGNECARLITTRRAELAGEFTQIKVDEMTTEEAARMLAAVAEPAPSNLTPFREIAELLGEWPLLIDLARGALRARLQRGQPLEEALAQLREAYRSRGAEAFDRRDSGQRNDAVSRSMGVSLEPLSEEERQRCFEVAIFPEDVPIPLSAVAAPWGMNPEDDLLRMDGLGLLKLDLATRTVRLHDVIRQWLGAQLPDAKAVHSRLAAAWGDPKKLPDDYAWRWIGYHLIEAGQSEEFRKLLLDVEWMEAKIEAADVSALESDFERMKGDPVLELVGDAVRLSSHVLARDPRQLPSQLAGRMLLHEEAALLRLEEFDKHPWLRPLWPSLDPAGGMLRRTLPHDSPVYAVAVTPDGRTAVSGCHDGTVKVWDLASGRLVRTFEGHAGGVNAVAVTGDGGRVVSGSDDKTVKVWVVGTGKLVRAFEGHADVVRAVAVTGDGGTVVSGSDDGTLKVWEVASGKPIAIFTADAGILCCAAAPGGRIFAGDWLGRIHVLQPMAFSTG
ncbi:MAG: TIR domain-containing protein [Acidobacteria bacterium]|nr:TIR domain-containing protein [Acidobacteriota bacterium]